jgi:hypothetical protein
MVLLSRHDVIVAVPPIIPPTGSNAVLVTAFFFVLRLIHNAQSSTKPPMPDRKKYPALPIPNRTQHRGIQVVER